METNKMKALFFIALIIVSGFTIGMFFYEKNQRKRYDVSIGFVEGDLHHLAYYVATEMGFYRDAGLNVTGIGFANGNEIMLNYASKNPIIDMAYVGFAPAVFHRFNNPSINIKILSAVNVNGTALIVKNNTSINEISDLVGLKIAVPALNNMQDFILGMTLQKAGLLQSNITISTMGVSNMPLLLAQGSIDGYVAWEPFGVKGLTNNVGKYLLKSGDIWANHPCSVLSGSNAFIEEKSQIAKNVVQVHKRATEWILNNWEDAISIAMRKMNLNQEQAEEAMEGTGYVYNFNIPQMIQFVEKIVQMNPTMSFDNPGIPNLVQNSSQFIDWFIDTSYLE